MQYTDDQRKAIEERGRNILVAAAAGSGKTRVLVDRIIMRLLKRECSVDQLLVVTFTNAAAAEMRERIEKALQKRLLEAEDQGEAAWLDRQSVLLTGASISTFHVFCQKVIRQNIEAVEVDPQFRLASEQEMVLMKRDVLENLLEEHYHEPERENYGSEEEYQAAKKGWQEFLAFADDYGNDHGDEAVYDAVLRLYEFSQSQPEPEVWLQRQADRFAVEDGADIWQSEWGQELWQNIERPGLKKELPRRQKCSTGQPWRRPCSPMAKFWKQLVLPWRIFCWQARTGSRFLLPWIILRQDGSQQPRYSGH